MREAATSNGGVQMDNDAVVAGGTLEKLDNIARLIHRLVRSADLEPDWDQTYVIGGNIGSASVFTFSIPRTVHHIECELSGSIAGEFALFLGQVALTDAQNRHNHTTGPQQSNAEAVSGGGKIEFRTYTNQDGLITIYFPAAYNGYVNVRIRNLDRTQARELRT